MTTPRARNAKGQFTPGLGRQGDRALRMDFDAPGAGPFLEFGAPGFKQSAGLLMEEYDPKLRGRRKYKKYEEMLRNSPIIATANYLVQMLVRSAPARDEPPEGYEDDPEAQALADWFTGMRADMEVPWDTFVAESCATFPFGWVRFERVHKLRKGDAVDPRLRSHHRDGLWGTRDLLPIAHDSLERWVFDDDENAIGLIQRVEGKSGSNFIPTSKSVVMQLQQRKQNPEPDGLLRPSYRPYQYETRITEIEAIGLERNMAGYPIAKVPWQAMVSNAPPALKSLFTRATDMVRKVRANEIAGVVWPAAHDINGVDAGFDFDLFKSSGKSAADTDTPIKRFRQDIAMIWLVQVLLLGSDSGSWALGKEFSALLAQGVNAFNRQRGEVVRAQLYVPLARLNGFPIDKVPHQRHAEIDKDDVGQLATAIASLSGGAPVFTMDDKLEDWLREKFGAPARDQATARIPSATAPNGEPAPAPADPEAKPTEDTPEPTIEAGAATNTVGPGVAAEALNGAQLNAQLQAMVHVNAGDLTFDQARTFLEVNFGIKPDVAARLIPEPPPKPKPSMDVPGVAKGGTDPARPFAK